MRISLAGLLLLLLIPRTIFAAWTGISAFAGEHKSDWLFGAQTQRADIFSYGLTIEEKSRPGLRIGLGAGQYDLRLLEPSGSAPVQDYDGQFFRFYLRWPFTLTRHLSLRTRFNYQFNVGEQSDPDRNEQIDWTEVSFRGGLALRIDLVTLQPFIQWRRIDGDLSSDSATRLFKQRGEQSLGLIVDLHVEPTAYVRLQAGFSTINSLYINFIREY